ncbi:PF20097 family protein [Wukongibacter baidiensis]|uniref:PF20097 family protein n=1 Tax=Wukongibacter baidiensis TaxID=1723361 RepID=UPI003D7F543B
MKCPYCNKDMAYGTLVGSRGDMTWYKLEERTDFMHRIFTSSGETIARVELTSSKVKGYRCYKCKKLIIDLKDEE